MKRAEVLMLLLTWAALLATSSLQAGAGGPNTPLTGRDHAGWVVNPRVTTDSTVDCSSADAVVRQVTRPDMTDEQKAVACWSFMLDHFYHWYPPMEKDVPTEVRDFAKAVNSYGFGPCFVNAPVLTDLWEAAGLETRSWTVTGHSIPEVKYGGAWHMLDADARAWHRKADGEIASVDELSKDAKLFTDPADRSVPYYPFGAPDAVAKVLEPWGPPSRIMDLYLSRGDNYRYNRRAVMGHPMYLTLRRGEKLILSAANEGKWYRFAGMPEAAAQSGPVEVNRAVTYGNGHLVYRPDMGKVAASDLLWLGSKNVRLAGGRLVAGKDGEPAVAIFRVWCPYVLVEAKADIGWTGAKPRISLSTDSGMTWTECASPELKDEVAGRYEYMLRAEFTAPAAIARADFDSTFQLAPLSLPRLKVGRNKVTVFRGPDEGVVQLVLGGKRIGMDPYIADRGGALALPDQVQPEKYGEPAFVVYRLVAPAALTALSVGANVTMNVAREQYVETSYSLDGGGKWTSIWKLADNTNDQNAQFEMDQLVHIGNQDRSGEVLIKFAMLRNSRYFAVQGVRLYAFYRQPQPSGAGLDVEIVWREKAGGSWEDRGQSIVAEKFPGDFELVCGGEEVRLSRIEMTPAP